MRLITLVLLALLPLTATAKADYFRIETGAYYGVNPINWTGQLIGIDFTTGIATFRYINLGTPIDIEVHITRIYSVTFNRHQILNRPFVDTQSRLTEPLPTRLTPRDQAIELSNSSGFLGDDIPPDVRVVPERNARVLTLRGTIVGFNDTDVSVLAWNDERMFTEFGLRQFNLRKWIRGI